MSIWKNLAGTLETVFRIGKGKAAIDASALTAARTFTAARPGRHVGARWRELHDRRHGACDAGLQRLVAAAVERHALGLGACNRRRWHVVLADWSAGHGRGSGRDNGTNGTNGTNPSPAGASGVLQYNNGGVLGGAANTAVEGGNLRIASVATPTAPADGFSILFGKSFGGRHLPAYIGPTGLAMPLQPSLARSRPARWLPAGNGTTITADGAAALTATGTATAANVATTNRHTWMRRLEYLVTAAATTAVAGFRAAAAMWGRGASAGDGGFHMVCQFGPATGVATTTSRLFVGMAAATGAPTDIESRRRSTSCGFGWDAADTNIQFMRNDGSGTATKIDLGATSRCQPPTAPRLRGGHLLAAERLGRSTTNSPTSRPARS